jgi:hypothetical protein
MRIAIISAPPQRKAPPDYVLSLAKGMEAMGHRVDVLDAWTADGYRLPGYEYIAVVTQALSAFSGRIPDVVSGMLSAAPNLGGKKSAAFVRKCGLFTARSLANLMKAMEKEGMMVNWSDILFNPPHAEAMGKMIGA